MHNNFRSLQVLEPSWRRQNSSSGSNADNDPRNDEITSAISMHVDSRFWQKFTTDELLFTVFLPYTSTERKMVWISHRKNKKESTSCDIFKEVAENNKQDFTYS